MGRTDSGTGLWEGWDCGDSGTFIANAIMLYARIARAFTHFHTNRGQEHLGLGMGTVDGGLYSRRIGNLARTVALGWALIRCHFVDKSGLFICLASGAGEGLSAGLINGAAAMALPSFPSLLV